MSERDDYPTGAPCWVDTLQPDPQAAARFYGQLFGWEFDEPVPMPGGLAGRYLAARIAGRLVAGVGQAPDAAATAVWSTYIRVHSVEHSITRAEDAGGALLMGPLEAGPDGRLGVLTDATGVAVSVWQAGERNGAQLVNEPGTWTMSSLHTASSERAQAFYSAVFGWQLDVSPGAPIALWRLPGYEGGEPQERIPRDVVAVMAPTDGSGAVPPHWSINFRVDDVDAAAEHALTLGGRILLPPTDTPGFRSAALADPQGGVVAISAPRTDPQVDQRTTTISQV
jgi:predicted enzyme related to lactoylglutathione lyase